MTFFFLSFLFCHKALCAPKSVQFLSLNPGQRLEAMISNDSMNRMSVEGDRIQSVYGDLDSYEVQTEETTGQIFLKPSVENGLKPLSLTLFTEKGATQDLLLKPSSMNGATLTLKPSHSPETPSKSGDQMDLPKSVPHTSSFNDQGTSLGSFSGLGAERPVSFSDHVLSAMKLLLAQQGRLIEVEEPVQRSSSNLLLSFQGAYQIGSFKGLIYEVQNTSSGKVVLSERLFYQQGDLALSLGLLELKPNASTTLGVITR